MTDEIVYYGDSKHNTDKVDGSYLLNDRDFDRGFVQMVCDRKEECDYRLPHYHCKICGAQVNSDQKRLDYHPCCSQECILAFNQ